MVRPLVIGVDEGGVTALPVGVLAWLGRSVLARREQRALLAAVMPCVLLYLIADPPGSTYYKFLMVVLILLAVAALLALPIWSICRWMDWMDSCTECGCVPIRDGPIARLSCYSLHCV